jgi:Mn-dependent DtxR family transcriptional regulator
MYLSDKEILILENIKNKKENDKSEIVSSMIADLVFLGYIAFKNKKCILTPKGKKYLKRPY